MAIHPIQQRLTRGELVLLDGALGTELERRGVETPLPLWTAQAILDAPEVVREVHEDYVRAGADMLTAATFRTTPRTMAKAERKATDADRLTVAAVALARDARARAGSGREIWVAGAMAPLEDCYRPQIAPPEAEAAREHAEQALRLQSAGVDLLLIETMNTIAEARAACEGAAATGLPFLISFICGSASEILSGEPLEEAARAVEVFHPSAILVNCTPPNVAIGCLETLAHSVQSPIGCYPNAGAPDFETEEWQFDSGLTPERFAAVAAAWIQRGAQVLGGCCGTGPDHIRALRSALPPVLIE
jgi:S-methylmethionine-dependent homocysteine/selenocysteine methylase